MGQKRGQVTIFIIIGLIILFIGFAYIKMNEDVTKVKDYQAIADPEIQPVKDYVELCIDSVAKDLLFSMGLRGGYLDVPPEIEFNPRATMSLDTRGRFKVPLWYYEGEYQIPELADMQEQLERRIESEVGFCIKGFEPLSDKYDIVEEGEMAIKVMMNELDVTVLADYPIEIKVGGKTSKLDKFASVQDVGFMRLYDMARLMMVAENEEMFFEDLTIDLMAMNPAIPFSGLDVSCVPKVWFTHEIQDEIQDMLFTNFRNIRVDNTNYRPFLADEETYEMFGRLDYEDVGREYLSDEEQMLLFDDVKASKFPDVELPDDAWSYHHLFWKPFEADYGDIFVRFNYYPSYGMDLVARPADGPRMASNMGQGHSKYMSFLCLNAYHFTYDVEYPVIAEVRDATSYNGEGFAFKFAFPVMIDHNQGDRLTQGTTIFEADVPFSGDCNNLGDPIDIRITGEDQGLVGMELEGANVSYNCFKYRCKLGETKPEVDAIKLKTGLPQSCAGGYLKVEKEGYHTIETQYGGENLVQIELPKLMKLTATAKKHEITAIESSGYQLADDDNVLVILHNKKYNIDSYYMINRTGIEIELVKENSDYDVKILLTDKNNNFYGGYNFNWTYSRASADGMANVEFHMIEQIPKPDWDSATDDIDEASLYDVMDKYKIFDEMNNPEHLAHLKPRFS